MAQKGMKDLDSRAWRAFHAINQRLLPHLGRQITEHSGLSSSEYVVLLALSELPTSSISLNRLATALGWEISRMSHQISRMQQAGLVKKVQNKSDARASDISITPRGRAIIESAIPLQSEEINHCFSELLTEDQKLTLIEISKAISHHLQQQHPLTTSGRKSQSLEPKTA